MGKKVANILKALFSIIVVCSTFLYIVDISDSDKTASILKASFKYKGIPYLSESDEFAMADDIHGNDYDVIDTFSGTVTAYGPDCKGCIGITASGYRVADTTIFTDSEYGDLRILAAAPQKFPYGSIIRISGPRIDGYITGIVLDTGGAMVNAWNEGKILIDLLFDSEKNPEVYEFGRQRNVTFEVLRYGQ